MVSESPRAGDNVSSQEARLRPPPTCLTSFMPFGSLFLPPCFPPRGSFELFRGPKLLLLVWVRFSAVLDLFCRLKRGRVDNEDLEGKPVVEATVVEKEVLVHGG